MKVLWSEGERRAVEREFWRQIQSDRRLRAYPRWYRAAIAAKLAREELAKRDPSA